jgi:hypothetical protein
MQPQIPPPDHSSPVPDPATKLGLPDHTGGGKADGRVMHVNLGFFKFGTDDRTQAVAFVLTILLLVMLGGLLIAPETEQAKSLFGILQNSLLLTIGVSVGNNASKSAKGD